MATLDSFFIYVQPGITSCPNPLVRAAILQSAIAFCEQSQAWSVRLPPVPLVLGQAAYGLTLPDQSQLVEVLNLWGESRELKGKSFNEMTLLIPNWRTMVGSPQYFVTDDVTDGIEVYPLPDTGAAGTSLLPRVALKPTVVATVVPDFLLNRFFETIANGALARLRLTPGQPWTDMALGSANQKAFDDACDEARIVALHGRVVGSLSVVPRAFGKN